LRSGMYREVAIADVVSTLLSSVIAIWMAYQGFGYWALVSRPRERLVAEAPERVAPAQPENDDELWQLVATLAPRQRAVVVLGYYEDLTDGQVAEALGCAIGTVKSQRAKALRTLRARLGEEQT